MYEDLYFMKMNGGSQIATEKNLLSIFVNVYKNKLLSDVKNHWAIWLQVSNPWPRVERTARKKLLTKDPPAIMLMRPGKSNLPFNGVFIEWKWYQSCCFPSSNKTARQNLCANHLNVILTSEIVLCLHCSTFAGYNPNLPWDSRIIHQVWDTLYDILYSCRMLQSELSFC